MSNGKLNQYYLRLMTGVNKFENNMVILSVTKDGFKELEPIILTGKYPLWIGAGVLTEPEIVKIREKGIELTNFSYDIDPDDTEAIDGAIETIAEHHPDQRIWLERKL